MTNKDLISGLSFIDDKLMDEAMSAKRQRKPVSTYYALAASFGLCALVGFATWKGGFLSPGSDGGGRFDSVTVGDKETETDSRPRSNTDEVTGAQSDTDSVTSESSRNDSGQSGHTDLYANGDVYGDLEAGSRSEESLDNGQTNSNMDGTNYSVDSSSKESAEQSSILEYSNDSRTNAEEEGNTGSAQDATDLPADKGNSYREAITVDDNSYDASMKKIFGGSYIADDGVFVIVITSDTPKNRSIICRELGVEEADVRFEAGKYTLTYLYQVQDKITDGMIDKTLSFVTSSAVYEMDNQIGVTVNTEDESKLDMLRACDPEGGAIRIELSKGQAHVDVEDLGHSEE